MADPKIEDRSDDMEDDLHKLEDHIADAEKKLQGRKEAAGVVDDDDPGATRSAEDVRAEVESKMGGGEADASDSPDERVDEERASPT